MRPGRNDALTSIMIGPRADSLDGWTALRLVIEHEYGDEDDHAPIKRFSVMLRDNRAAAKCSNRTARYRPYMTGVGL